jgi:hypothetical protein
VVVVLILDSFGLLYVGLSIGMWSSEKLLPTRHSEFIPLVLGICIWSHQLQSKKLIMHIDNLAFVHINKQTSRNPRVLSLVRHSILVSSLYNVQIKAIHVGGERTKLQKLFLIGSETDSGTWIQQHLIILVRYLQNFGACVWECVTVDQLWLTYKHFKSI